ncbi:hypothetical protein FOMG_04479 [Fusarium oxysporum f. sp. melonis 26406]|uniref:BTB domain-containing protein n=1 Tax=Fusarium oxysporum f. sp. melonis 26406 TaxID=1089452 RepID=X0AJ62_FUSOX|nr:hypothetical protein FOMG_04479 [Fusarium oxysporum f. sp. melonis 26406]
MAPQPHSFLLHLVESGEFSDFTLICKDREFKLHQVIVCPQSPVISAALHSGFEETTSKVVTVNEFDVATVQSMVTFLYTGDYKLAPETEKPVQVKDGDEKSEEGEIDSEDDNMSKDSPASQKIEDKTAEKILSHLRVNAIADYYNIEKLAKHSTSKIYTILQDDLDFLILPKIIEEMSTTTRDADLRSLIAKATAKYIGELTSLQVLRTLELEHNLAIDILEAYGKRIQPLLEDLSAARVLQNSYKQARNVQQRHKNLTVAKIRSVLELLENTTKCRNCNKEFGCYIQEPAGAVNDPSRYALRCSGCQCRH